MMTPVDARPKHVWWQRRQWRH